MTDLNDLNEPSPGQRIASLEAVLSDLTVRRAIIESDIGAIDKEIMTARASLQQAMQDLNAAYGAIAPAKRVRGTRGSSKGVPGADTLPHKVLACLQAQPQMPIADISTVVFGGSGADARVRVRTLLNSLKHRGLVESVGRGAWVAIAAAPEASATASRTAEAPVTTDAEAPAIEESASLTTEAPATDEEAPVDDVESEGAAEASADEPAAEAATTGSRRKNRKNATGDAIAVAEV